MTGKSKRQHTLPNRQLARAFQFTAQDLAANRAGFMSRAQEWRLALWMREFFGWLDDALPLWLLSPGRRQRVAALCGRVRLEYVQQEIHALFHTDIRESHYLFVEDERFLLNARQYRAVANRVPYYVYFSPQSHQILSLERAINGCDETHL